MKLNYYHLTLVFFVVCVFSLIYAFFNLDRLATYSFMVSVFVFGSTTMILEVLEGKK